MPKSTPPDHALQILPKARIAVEATSLLGEPAIAITDQKQSLQSADADDWSAVNRPVILPVAHLEELVYLLRQAAREATP